MRYSAYGIMPESSEHVGNKMSNSKNHSVGGRARNGVGIIRGQVDHDHETTRSWTESDASKSGLSDREPM